jgi:hypothetical protein
MEARIGHVTDSRDTRPTFGIMYRKYSDTRSSWIVIQADNGDHAMQELRTHLGTPHYVAMTIREL